MRYDDRLATVLRLTPVGPNVARIQFRQLLDLLGTRPVDDQGEMLDHAYMRLAELGAKLPAGDRTSILRGAGLRLRSPRLVGTLATGEPQVAQAALHAAQLTDEQWLDLIPALPLAARGLMRGRDDLGPGPRALLARLGIGDQALPQGEQAERTAPVQPALAPEEAAPAEPFAMPDMRESDAVRDSDIAAIVRRIEAFRQARTAPASDAPRLPLGEEPHKAIVAFDFTSDVEGRVTWSENPVAPMMVGHHLGSTRAAATAIQLHQPLREVTVRLEGAADIAGLWQVDAMPRFEPQSGRFIGHIGRFRRRKPRSAERPEHRPESDTDRLRQLLHELRTPVNAIQGFAEVIQQQLFGPTPHEYRALSAGIAADAARILAGFEELDRYAKLDSGTMEIDAGHSDLATCLGTMAARFPATLRFEAATAALPLALAPQETERLCWRLLAALATHAAQGETLPLAAAAFEGKAVLRMALPQALAALDDSALYSASAPAASPATPLPAAGMFGTGFALRLARAEARAAGGELGRDGALLILTLPLIEPLSKPDLSASVMNRL